MNPQLKVLLYLKRNEQDANNLCPLMGRITINGHRNSVAQFSTKLKISPNLWNATSGRLTGKSKVAIKTNKEIESLLLLLRMRFNELSEFEDTVSAIEVKNTFQGIATTQATLLKLFREHNEEYSERVGVNRVQNSYYKYTSTYAHLSKFIVQKYKVSDVSLKSLDLGFIEAFDRYLRVDKRHQPNTINGHIVRLKVVINTAVNKGLIAPNPFNGFRTEKPVQRQRYLTQDELEKLMTTPLNNPMRNFVRDMFLFSVFTGICYCDICNLTKKNLKRDKDGNLWIETKRQKTGTQENVLLLDVAIQIIEKHKTTGDRLFAMPTYRAYLKQLKKVALDCGITRNLTFHMARHTFASEICIGNGVPIEAVSKAMGHKDIMTTQRYAKVTHEKIDKDMTMLNLKINRLYA